MSENDKAKVKTEDLPVPLKDLSPEEQQEIQGGSGVGTYNPSTPTNLNPTLIKKPNADQY